MADPGEAARGGGASDGEALVVAGGRTPLRGEVRPGGSKNATLPILVASLLARGETTLSNIPTQLLDVQALLDLLRSIGVGVEVDRDRVHLDTRGELASAVDMSRGRDIRYSRLFLGALLARTGRGRVPYPGGCRIGDRKFDLHLLGLERLGATVAQDETGIEVTAAKLAGAEVEFYLPTTSGTENVVIAASLAAGRTTLINANTRPEIRNLAAYLNSMGARIRVLNRIIEIEGVAELRAADWSVMPGRDEAFTYMVACGVRGGEIVIPGLATNIMRAEIEQLRHAGIEAFDWGGAVYIASRQPLQPIDIQTAPYPGINSDLQPLFAGLALAAGGVSTITDTRFPDRFGYAEEMRKLGADIHACGNCAIVRGGAPLRGGTVKALDIRTGAALVIAGLAAEGETTILDVHQIDRGYERIEEKLRPLGASIRRVRATPERRA